MKASALGFNVAVLALALWDYFVTFGDDRDSFVGIFIARAVPPLAAIASVCFLGRRWSKPLGYSAAALTFVEAFVFIIAVTFWMPGVPYRTLVMFAAAALTVATLYVASQQIDLTTDGTDRES
jgi:hypothetical protein